MLFLLHILDTRVQDYGYTKLSVEIPEVFFFFVIRAQSICSGCTAALRLIVQPC